MFSLFAASLAFKSPLIQSSLPGNVNFDPLRLCSIDLRRTPPRPANEILDDYYEAELKHGRLAMLAAVAYPVQETVNPILSKALHLPDRLAEYGLSPSLLNGDLPPATLIAFIGFASALEMYKMKRVDSPIPGDYNWRFTKVTDADEFTELMAGEAWNGRIAMLAVLGYVVQEYVTKTPVLG